MTEPQLTDQLRALRIDPPDNGFGLRLSRALEREARLLDVQPRGDLGAARWLSASAATQWGRRGLAGLAVAASVSAAWFAANWDERANLGAERGARSSAELEETPALPSTPEPPRAEDTPLTREAQREQDDAQRAPARREAPRDESPTERDAPVQPTARPVDAPSRAPEPAPLRSGDARPHDRERPADGVDTGKAAEGERTGSVQRRDAAHDERARVERERPNRRLERLELPDVERRVDRERERRESVRQSRERDAQRDWVERRRLREDDARSREPIDERRPEYRDPRREVERDFERTRDADRGDRRGIDARGERRLQRSESR